MEAPSSSNDLVEYLEMSMEQFNNHPEDDISLDNVEIDPTIELMFEPISDPNLLLAMSFKVFQKELLLGYSPITLEPTFYLINEQKKVISLPAAVFTELVQKDLLNVWRQSAIAKGVAKLNRFSSNNAISFKTGKHKKEDNLILDLHFSLMFFTLEEIKYLIALKNLFTYKITCCFNNSEDVKNYYKWYVEKCRQKNTTLLGIEDFENPATQNHIDFLQLFYEIPLLCKIKLNADINQI